VSYLKFVCKMILIRFLCLCTWENRLLCLNLCCFGKTKVEMLKHAALMARCLTNNPWKFHQKILNYSENNEIFVRGLFLAAPCICEIHFHIVQLMNLKWTVQVNALSIIYDSFPIFSLPKIYLERLKLETWNSVHWLAMWNISLRIDR